MVPCHWKPNTCTYSNRCRWVTASMAGVSVGLAVGTNSGYSSWLCWCGSKSDPRRGKTERGLTPGQGHTSARRPQARGTNRGCSWWVSWDCWFSDLPMASPGLGGTNRAGMNGVCGGGPISMAMAGPSTRAPSNVTRRQKRMPRSHRTM